MEAPLIAVIDDDLPFRQMLDEVLTDEGYRTFLWPSGKDVHLMIQQVNPDLIILDMWLEYARAGEQVLGLLELDPRTRQIPVIICSGNMPLLQSRNQEFRQKGYRLLEKPFDMDDLLAQITAVVGKAHRSNAEAE